MEYQIHRSTRAKRLQMRLNDAGEVTLVLPRFVPEAAGRIFAKANWSWVEAQRHKIKARPQIETYQDFTTGSELTFFDQKKYSIRLVNTHKLNDSHVLIDQVLEVYLGTKEGAKQERIKTQIEKFYRGCAHTYLTERSLFWSEKLGAAFNDLRIKNTRSRWGSCSSKKNLNYNWRIMLAPMEVIDYLVVHEVCHLKQMNHSVKFWSLVENLDPNFKAHKKWLKDHQSRLFGFLS